jgi:nesprin-1
MKSYREKFGALQRLVTTNREKVMWCEPEQSSDRYNLEVKLASLNDVEADIHECDVKKHETDLSLSLLEKVESPETLKILHGERETVHVDLEALKICFINIKKILERNILTWQRYEAMSDNVVSWLKKAENKVRAEGSILLVPYEIENKYKEINEFQSSFLSNKVEILKLITFSKQITDVST